MTIERIDAGPRMSQAVIHNGTVYLSGIVGEPGESVANQTRTILDTIGALLDRAGSSKGHILSATIWLSDISEFQEMNRVWDTWFAGIPSPARATSEAKLATPDYKVEIVVTAAVAKPGE